MAEDLSRYFQLHDARMQIGQQIRQLFSGKVPTKSQAASQLCKELGLQESATYSFLRAVFNGDLYGTTSIRAIRRHPNTKRKMLSALLSWLGVPPEDPLVAKITSIDSGFKADPNAYENKNSAPGNETSNGGLESRVEDDTVPPPTLELKTVEPPYRATQEGRGGNVTPQRQYGRNVLSPAPVPVPVQRVIVPISTAIVPARAVVPPNDHPPVPEGYKPFYPNMPTSEIYKEDDSIIHPVWGKGTVTKSEYTPQAASRHPFVQSYAIDVKFLEKPREASRLVGENTVRLLVMAA